MRMMGGEKEGGGGEIKKIKEVVTEIVNGVNGIRLLKLLFVFFFMSLTAFALRFTKARFVLFFLPRDQICLTVYVDFMASVQRGEKN